MVHSIWWNIWGTLLLHIYLWLAGLSFQRLANLFLHLLFVDQCWVISIVRAGNYLSINKRRDVTQHFCLFIGFLGIIFLRRMPRRELVEIFFPIILLRLWAALEGLRTTSSTFEFELTWSLFGLRLSLLGFLFIVDEVFNNVAIHRLLWPFAADRIHHYWGRLLQFEHAGGNLHV